MVSWLCTVPVSLWLAAWTEAPPKIETVAIEMPHAKPKFFAWEPHLVADPDDPDRLLLTAIHRGLIGEGKDARFEARLSVWHSIDRGKTWSNPLTPLPASSPAGPYPQSDPVLAFGVDGYSWFVGGEFEIISEPGKQAYYAIKSSRSKNWGEDWQPPTVVTTWEKDAKERGFVDKPWIAVDRSVGSHRGTAYIVWSRVSFPSLSAELCCAARPPDASEFSKYVPIAKAVVAKGVSDISHHSQVAVRTNGTVDVVWRELTPTSVILHASSEDGGRSFSKPMPICEDAAIGVGEFPSMKATHDGGLVAAWNNASGIHCSVHSSGKWSKPTQVFKNDRASVRYSTATVATDANSLWLLAYRMEANPERVTVLLKRTTNGGASWTDNCALGSRDFAPGKGKAFMPGHYVGLTAAKNGVVAAYILPSEGGDGTPWKLYVSRVE